MTWGERPRERELQCLANAMLHGRKEAARRMGISPSTLRNHLTNLNDRLGAENMREAAFALGWLNIPEQYVTTGAYPLPDLDGDHHPQAEQLLAYATAILRELDRQ